jgi:hypothetical protein
MDSFTAALSRLDPASRALLDLSLRRGMRPEEIGELLGTDPESVIVARESALEQLADELGMDDVSELDDVRARLAELPPEAWTGQAAVNGASTARPKLAVVEGAPKEEKEKSGPQDEERKSRLPLLLALLAAAALVLVIVLATSGGSDGGKANTAASKPASPKPNAAKPKPNAAKPAPAPAPKPPAAAPKVQLNAIGRGSGAHGSAALTHGGKRLRLDVSGLPDPHGGAYQVWLYDSVIDAASLTKVRGTRLSLDLKLPRNASHYRYVDVSYEPADGNPNHSGESVLRVPLAKLSH